MSFITLVKEKLEEAKASLGSISGLCHRKGEGTRLTVGGILRCYLDDYKKEYPLTLRRQDVLAMLMACRTGLLGGHVKECAKCKAKEFWYKSCRDRHCPLCGKFKRAEWVLKQQTVLLPIPYYHVIFTTGHELNEWVPLNREVIYNLLFRTVNEVLKEFAAEYLGGEIGFTAVLHTWGQQMQPHVHLHCIVTGGALREDGKKWVAAKKTFLFPAKRLSKVFRDRFCEGVLTLAREEILKYGPGQDMAGVEASVETMQRKRWEIFIKPFEKADAVYDYLSRYVHQVAISHHRLVRVEKGAVTFRYHDNQAGGQEKEMTLSAVEFIRRFVWHILPEGYHRLRHYGLHHAGCRKKLMQARVLLGLPAEVPQTKTLDLKTWLTEILGEEEIDRCPRCGESGTMVEWRDFGRINWKQAFAMQLMGVAPYGAGVG